MLTLVATTGIRRGVRRLPNGAGRRRSGDQPRPGESLGEEFDLDVVKTTGSGLVGQEDLDELIEDVEPGTSVLVFLFENTRARSIAAAVRDTGAVVISAQRFPADVVNEVAELAGVSA